MENKRQMDKVQSLEIKDFDDIFPHIGGWGRFQILLTLLFLPFSVFLGYTYYSPLLTTYTPPHWCRVPALENLTIEARKNLAIPNITKEGVTEHSKCSQYHVDWKQVLSSGKLAPNSSWPVVVCLDGWEYDYQNYHISISSELDWVCDNDWIPATSYSLFFLGSVPGTLFFGWLSDHHGRLPTIIISNIIPMICGILIGFVNSYIPYFILMFCMGTAYNTHFTAMYILAMEYVEESKRALIGNIGLATCLTLSRVYQPWILRYLGDWRVFNWIIFSQMVIIVSAPWIIPESARWLMSQGKNEKCLTIIKNIAKINNKQVPEEVYVAFSKICNNVKGKQEKSLTFLDLFKTPTMRRNSIIGISLWMLINLIFDGHVRNIENLNFSIYISFSLSGFLELPADILTIPGLDYLGRRWSAAISLFLSGLFMIPCAWLQDDWLAVAVLAMSGWFLITYAMNTGFQLVVEIMPTQLRGQGTALANVMASAASMLSPYIAYSGSFSAKAPFLILGVLGVVSGFPGLLLPETAGITLPDSIEQVNNFGKNEKFFWIPLMGKSTRFKNKRNQTNGRCNEAYEDEDRMRPK